MAALLNYAHETFCRLVAEGKSAPEAYVAAGYAAHESAPYVFRNKPHIDKRIRELVNKAAAKAEITAAGILAEMWKIFTFNPSDAFKLDKRGRPIIDLSELDKDQASAIDITVDVDQDGNEKTRIVLAPASVRLKAGELLGKRLGLWIERHEHGKPGDFTGIESTEAIIEKLRAELGERDALLFETMIKDRQQTEQAKATAQVIGQASVETKH